MLMYLENRNHMEDLDGTVGNWLQPSPAPAIVAVWEVNLQLENPSFSLCLSYSDFE